MVVARRYHFHGSGLIYIITTGVLVLGAINGQNNLLFWCFGVAVAGLILSGLISGSSLMGLDIQRLVPESGEVGVPMRVGYRLTNRNRFLGVFAVVVEEMPQAGFGRYRSTWRDHMPRPTARAVYVGPRSTLTLEALVTPARRGVATFGPMRAWSVFPLGLFKKSVIAHQPGTVLIRPRPARVRDGAWGMSGIGDDDAQRRRSTRFGGQDFFALREYAPGDPSRRIAWRPSARQDRLVVRENADPSTRRFWLVVSPPSQPGHAQEHVLSAGAGVAQAALAQGWEVGLLHSTGEIGVLIRGGLRQLGIIQDALATHGNEIGVETGQGARFIRDDAVVFVALSSEPAPGWIGDARRVHADDPSDVTPNAPVEGWSPPRMRFWDRAMALVGDRWRFRGLQP